MCPLSSLRERLPIKFHYIRVRRNQLTSSKQDPQPPNLHEQSCLSQAVTAACRSRNPSLCTRACSRNTQLRIPMLAFAPRLAVRRAAPQCPRPPRSQLAQARPAAKHAFRGFALSAPARNQPLPDATGRDKAAVGVRYYSFRRCLRCSQLDRIGIHTKNSRSLRSNRCWAVLLLSVREAEAR